jgi:hypothetical protein
MSLGPIVRSLRFVPAVALLASLPFARAQAQGVEQAKTAALAGTVRDTSGRGIAGVEIVVDSLELNAVTDDSGQFHLPGIPAGRNGFIVRKIGYEAASFETSLAAEKTLVIQVTLRNSVNTLNTATITGERLLPGLAKAGFYDRERRGLGRFMRPEGVDSIAHTVSTPSQMLRQMPGIDVQCRRGGACALRSRTPPYCMHVFIDGKFVPPVDNGGKDLVLDVSLTADAIGAFEVYRHPSEVPAEFEAPMIVKDRGPRSMTAQAGCGVVAVWTKVKSMR